MFHGYMKLLEGKAKSILLQNVNRNGFFSTIFNSEVDYWVFHMAPFFEMKNYQYATEKKNHLIRVKAFESRP